MANVLVVAAHPDDEVLGCGGVIARLVAQGDQVYALYLTDGQGAREEGKTKKSQTLVKNRRNAAEKAASILGLKKCWYENFPDNAMDSVVFLDIVKAVESVNAEVNADTVYTHYFGDLNIDHQLTHRAVMTAFRPQVNCSVKSIFSFEVLSSTEWSGPMAKEFLPQYVVDISDYWDTKMEALTAYQDEMKVSPHSRSYTAVEALAKLRGQTHGFQYAEAFYINRILLPK